MDSLALRTKRIVFGAAGIAMAVSAQAGTVPREFVYTVNVQVHDGRIVQCAVNEPPRYPAVSAPALTTDERVEAEVLATQRLRLLSGPRGPYPAGDTAPAITCFALSG
jgi:hypothetical protein